MPIREGMQLKKLEDKVIYEDAIKYLPVVVIPLFE